MLNKIITTPKKWRTALYASVIGASLASPVANAGDTPFIGDIMMFAGTFCPVGWAAAEGQLINVSDNNALFSIYGTRYGGNGRTTFGLPDLRGRVVVGAGQSTGLTLRTLGEKGGEETFKVSGATLGNHSHAATTTSTFHASSSAGDSPMPSGQNLADDENDEIYLAYASAAPDVTMKSDAATSATTVSATGGGDIEIAQLQPFLVIQHCVALIGVYPTQS